MAYAEDYLQWVAPHGHKYCDQYYNRAFFSILENYYIVSEHVRGLKIPGEFYKIVNVQMIYETRLQRPASLVLDAAEKYPAVADDLHKTNKEDYRQVLCNS